MALYKAEGYVIGAKNWGETNRMMVFFTKERGIVKAMAFGCRRPRSPLAAGMQMFSLLDMQLAEGKRVDTVRQCAIRHSHQTLREDLSAIAYAAFVAELLRAFLPEGEPEPNAYERLGKIFSSFEWRNPRVTAIAAAFQLMEFTGLQLHYKCCVHCACAVHEDAFFSIEEGGVLCSNCRENGAISFPKELQTLILALRDFDWDTHTSIHIAASLLVQAEQILLAYLEHLLGRPMKSLQFIRQLT